jgi:hypothetical protein
MSSLNFEPQQSEQVSIGNYVLPTGSNFEPVLLSGDEAGFGNIVGGYYKLSLIPDLQLGKTYKVNI